MDIAKIKRRIERTKKKIEAYKKEHGDKPSLTHTYHGGWALGYWEGRLSTLEELLDEIEGDSN